MQDKEFLLEAELDSIMNTKSISDDSLNTGVNTYFPAGYICPKEFRDKKKVGKYTITKCLGSGSSSKVNLGINTDNGEKVAIKIVKKNLSEEALNKESQKRRDGRIYREVIISSLVRHPHIVRLLDFLYNDSHFFLVFEYVKGKQLLDMVMKDGAMKEKDAQRYYRQILSAIDFIHKNSIVHRDLKIENILIDEQGNAKLLDFGLSNFYDNKRLLNTFCGSLYFAAPELLQGDRYCGPEIDIWSLGIVLYVLLCGKVPFDDSNIHVLHSKIKKGKFVYLKSISSEAKELISGMILADPSQRYGLEQIIRSEWVNKDHDIGIDNYMSDRYPLGKLDKKYIHILKTVIGIQFPNMESDIMRYIGVCKTQNEPIEREYWSGKPAVSLYYLMLENFGFEGDKVLLKDCNEKVEGKVVECDSDDGSILSKNTDIQKNRSEIVHNFVNFLFSKEKESSFSKYFSGDIFLKSDSEISLNEKNVLSIDEKESQKEALKNPVLPVVKKALFKGLLNRIPSTPIKCQFLLKRSLIEFFIENNIEYDVKQRHYMCGGSIDNRKVEFKVSLYFNILSRNYHLSITKLSGLKEDFKFVLTLMKNKLRSVGS